MSSEVLLWLGSLALVAFIVYWCDALLEYCLARNAGRLNRKVEYFLWALLIAVLLLLAVSARTIGEWIHYREHYGRDLAQRHCSVVGHVYPPAAPFVHPSTALPPLVLARPAYILLEFVQTLNSLQDPFESSTSRGHHLWPLLFYRAWRSGSLQDGAEDQPFAHGHPLPKELFGKFLGPSGLEDWATQSTSHADVTASRHKIWLDGYKRQYQRFIRRTSHPEKCLGMSALLLRWGECNVIYLEAAGWQESILRELRFKIKHLQQLISGNQGVSNSRGLVDFQTGFRAMLLDLEEYRFNITNHIYQHSFGPYLLPPRYIHVLQNRYLLSTIATAHLQAQDHLISHSAIPFIEDHIAIFKSLHDKIQTSNDSFLHLNSTLRLEFEESMEHYVSNLTASVWNHDPDSFRALVAGFLAELWSSSPSIENPASSFSSWLSLPPSNALRCPTWKAWYFDPYDLDEQWGAAVERSIDDEYSLVRRLMQPDWREKGWSLNRILEERGIGQ